GAFRALAGQFAIGPPQYRTDQVPELARPGAAIGLGGALSASPASGIGTARDADQLSRAGLLQCPVLGSRRAERLLLRSAYQAVHRPGECAPRMVSGHPVGGQGDAQ